MTTAREPSMWDWIGAIVGEDNASPEEKRDRSRIAREQWAQYAREVQRFDDNSGDVEIISEEGNQ